MVWPVLYQVRLMRECVESEASTGVVLEASRCQSARRPGPALFSSGASVSGPSSTSHPAPLRRVPATPSANRPPPPPNSYFPLLGTQPRVSPLIYRCS